MIEGATSRIDIGSDVQIQEHLLYKFKRLASVWTFKLHYATTKLEADLEDGSQDHRVTTEPGIVGRFCTSKLSFW
jgi:hypothetical protein